MKHLQFASLRLLLLPKLHKPGWGVSRWQLKIRVDFGQQIEAQSEMLDIKIGAFFVCKGELD